MPSCVFQRCGNYTPKSYGITYHAFPLNSTSRIQWTKIVRTQRREDDWQPNSSSRICSAHFNDEDKFKSPQGRMLLSKTAVPFLEVKKRKKKETVDELEVEQSPDEYEDDGSESPVHIVIKEEPEIERSPPKIKYISAKPRLTRVLKRRIIKDNTLSERSKLLERKLYKRSDLYKKKDECDTFGEYIATSLRKHDERTRSMIKQAINNILFEQEMKKYNSGQYAVVISSMDENPLIIGDECEK